MPSKVYKAINLIIALAIVNLLNSYIFNGQIRNLNLIDIIVLVVQVFVMATIIYMLYKGKNWVRYLLLFPIVMMTIFLPFRIGILLKENLQNGLSIIVGYIVQSIAVVLLFSKEGDEWFKPKK